MSNGGKQDLARQVVTVVGAFFQVVVPILTGPAIQRFSQRLIGCMTAVGEEASGVLGCDHV